MKEMGTPRVYEIRIAGHIGDSWSSWFEGLEMRREESGSTVLTGPLIDEAALYGVLMKLRDLGLPLIEVRRLQSREAAPADTAAPEDTATAEDTAAPADVTQGRCEDDV